MAAVKALYRSTTANVNKYSTPAQRASSVRIAWNRADVLKLNEANNDATIDAVRSLPGANWYYTGSIAGQNPIIWRAATFERMAYGEKVAYIGGKGDGPSRGVSWVLLRHKVTKKRVLEMNMHQIAKALSTEPDRLPEWRQINTGVAQEIKRVMGLYPDVPVVLSGDMNAPGDIDFPGVLEREVSTGATYGNRRYDRFFLVGRCTARADATFDTPSDHQGVQVNIELLDTTDTGVVVVPPKTVTASTGTNPGTGGTTSAPTPSATPSPGNPTAPVVQPVIDLAGGGIDGVFTIPAPLPAEAVRAQATYRRRPEWRYFAQRMNGDGTGGEIIHPELPLQDTEIEDVLTGHNSLRGKLSPVFKSLLADDGLPVMGEYKTAIWAEESGNIHGGGILTDSGFTGPDWNIECTGLTSYLTAMPYTSSTFFVEADPLDILRHIWAHVQGQPFGNVGLDIDTTKSDIRIGTILQQGEFDTQNGPLSFEDGPFKLAWWQDHDLAEVADRLATDYKFDWHEEHRWEGDILRHFLRLGVPTIGRRRNDLRFVIGENVHVVPTVDRDGSIYATEVMALGAGDASEMKRGSAVRANSGGLRRVAVVADPSARSDKSVRALAEQEMAWRSNLDDITEIVVRQHPHADIGSVQMGDEINLEGETLGWLEVDAWVRVVSRVMRPQGDGTMTLSVQRTDRQS